MRLGIFLPNWLGDVVMATPAIRALRELVGPQGRLIGIMRPYVFEVLSGSEWLDETILYEKPSGRLRVVSRRNYQQLRCAELDRVVLFTNSLRTAWMAFRSGARERIGFAGDMRSWLLTKRLPRPQLPLATIDGYLKLAVAAGAIITSRRMELKTGAADELAADAAWEALGLPAGEPVVLLNSGGAYGAAKRWPAEHFAELARRIVADGRSWVLINCGPASGRLPSKSRISRATRELSAWRGLMSCRLDLRRPASGAAALWCRQTVAHDISRSRSAGRS